MIFTKVETKIFRNQFFFLVHVIAVVHVSENIRL